MMGNALAKDAYGLAPLISYEITCEFCLDSKEESEDLLEWNCWICDNISLSSEKVKNHLYWVHQ